MNTIDPDVIAALMVQADYKPGSQPTQDLLRLVGAVVEHCATIADLHEPCDGIQEPGAQIRAEFGLC